MLANAYLPGIVAIFGAVASLLLAIILELPILKLIWRRPLLRLAGWVLLANLLSAAVGMVPVFNDAGPGVTADPWEFNQQAASRFARQVGVLLAITLISEGLVYFALNRRAAQRITGGRLIAGLMICNLASYGVLVGLSAPGSRSVPSDQFLKDTAWLGPCEQRIWFVEAGSHHLCSIRLDGTDRRTEVAEAMGRFDVGWFEGSFYALGPEQDSIMFLGPDLEWRVHGPAGTRSLGIKSQPDSRGVLDREKAAEALQRISGLENKGLGPIWANLNPQLRDPVYMWDQAEGYQADTMIAGGGAAGFGLSVKGHGKDVRFKIPATVAGPLYLVCSEPAILPERKLVVFRCSAWIMVMDIESGRVGRLVQGDSIVAVAPAFKWRGE